MRKNEEKLSKVEIVTFLLFALGLSTGEPGALVGVMGLLILWKEAKKWETERDM